MKTILTYGTFDLFHIGHVHLLQRARNYGDELVVGISTDEFTTQIKRKSCFIPYDDRKVVLQSCRYVDFVFPEYAWDQKESDIIKYNVSVFIIGDDWKGKFDYLSSLCEVIYLPRTEGISSTLLREQTSHVLS